MSVISFANLDLILADGWVDITSDLPEGTPPTIAKPDGVGVLQFSIAKYVGGAHPMFDADALKKLLFDFALTHELGEGTNIRETGLAVSGDFARSDEFIRAWYVSDGSSVALITYLVKDGFDRERTDELAGAELIVKSIRFSEPLTT